MDPSKLQRELEIMRDMIASDPEVRRHFDANGDGVIDGSEWDAVVQLVTHRLHREAQEAERSRRIMAGEALASPPVAEHVVPPPREPGDLARDLYVADVVPHIEAGHAPINAEAPRDLVGFARLDIERRESARSSDFRFESESIVYDHRGREVAVFGRHSPEAPDIPEARVATRDQWTLVSPLGEQLVQLWKPPRRSDGAMRIAVDGKVSTITQTSGWFGRDAYALSWDGGEATCKHEWFDACIYHVVDATGAKLGRIERDFGFLNDLLNTKANAIRVVFEPAAPPAARWSMLATAVHIDRWPPHQSND